MSDVERHEVPDEMPEVWEPLRVSEHDRFRLELLCTQLQAASLELELTRERRAAEEQRLHAKMAELRKQINAHVVVSLKRVGAKSGCAVDVQTGRVIDAAGPAAGS